MADIVSRELAISLRKQGESINDISSKLEKPKSTISYWCRDVVLSKKQFNNLLERQINSGRRQLIEYAEKRRAQRITDTIKYNRLGENEIGKITKRDLFILGLALYWGEGYKNKNEEVGFTNSDPNMIRVMVKWFNNIYEIDNSRFICRLSINSIHKAKESECLKFWSDKTKIPLNQFTKSSFIKSINKKVYSDNENYYGILRIKVRKGRNLHRKILGSIHKLSKI